MLEERGTPLLRQMALTSGFARVCGSKNALQGTIVHILGPLRRHHNFLAFWQFQEWAVAIIVAMEHFPPFIPSFLPLFMISISRDLKPQQGYSETVFRKVSWSSSKNYL